jgi:hypothetical protein
MPSRPPTHRPQQWKPREQHERERRAQLDEQRPSSTERGYDATWRKLRLVFIRQHPVCSTPRCGDMTTDVDHVQSVEERPDLRLEWSNLRAYCHACHSRRTALEQGFARPGKRD